MLLHVLIPMYFGDDESVSRVRFPQDEALVDRLAAKLVPARASRRERLERIKQAVDSSDYENPLKLSIALDRVLDRISKLGG